MVGCQNAQNSFLCKISKENKYSFLANLIKEYEKDTFNY